MMQRRVAHADRGSVREGVCVRAREAAGEREDLKNKLVKSLQRLAFSGVSFHLVHMDIFYLILK